MQTLVESHLPRHRIMMLNKRLGVVDQDLRRNAAEPQESASIPSNQSFWRSLSDTRVCKRRE
jgi:hypothetical protein